MLVLTRAAGESIHIEHGRIIVTVVEIRQHTVRLAFEAAGDIPIHREEIELRIQKGQDNDA